MIRRGVIYLSIYTVIAAYILWEQINDFIVGQVMNNGSLVEWAKEDTKYNKKELRHIQQTLFIVQTWYIILYFIFLFTTKYLTEGKLQS